MTIRPRSRDTGRERCAVVSAATSLRDRKRDETRRSLADAAYAIVRDEGVEALTAEAVADRAGVSRRTFFNYFPSVDSVLTASLAQFFDSVTERLHARPADEDVLDTALACLTDSSDTELLERIAVIARAAEVSTHARGLVLVEMHAWLDELEEWLRGRLPEGTSDLVVATTASIAVGAAEGAFRVWARAAANPAAEPVDLSEAVATSLAIARAGLGSAHGRPDATGHPHRTGSAAGRSS